MEFLQRRYHLNRAIGYCYALKQEMQYAIETLPVDINKYKRFAELIDKQIALYKGVRSASNKFLNGKNPDSLANTTGKLFESIIAVIRKVGKIEDNTK